MSFNVSYVFSLVFFFNFLLCFFFFRYQNRSQLLWRRFPPLVDRLLRMWAEKSNDISVVLFLKNKNKIQTHTHTYKHRHTHKHRHTQMFLLLSMFKSRCLVIYGGQFCGIRFGWTHLVPSAPPCWSLASLGVLVRVVCVFWGSLHSNLLSTILLYWDTGGRHWGVLGDVGPLHSRVGRNICARAAHGQVA